MVLLSAVSLDAERAEPTLMILAASKPRHAKTNAGRTHSRETTAGECTQRRAVDRSCDVRVGNGDTHLMPCVGEAGDRARGCLHASEQHQRVSG